MTTLDNSKRERSLEGVTFSTLLEHTVDAARIKLLGRRDGRSPQPDTLLVPFWLLKTL